MEIIYKTAYKFAYKLHIKLHIKYMPPFGAIPVARAREL
jgi:hypothetical protein